MSDKSDTVSDFASLKELFKDVTPIEQNRADIQRPVNKPDEGAIEYRRLAAAEKEELIVDGLNSTHHELLSAEESILFAVPGVQLKLVKRMQSGHLGWDAGLDLHGFNVDQARNELHLFIRDCRKQGLKSILIIHGKSYTDPNKPALLKTYVSEWLQQTEGVLAFCSAQPKDGGTGAVYVLLKTDESLKSNR
jgi:DNA-nicking Smr family endonuclease